MIYLHLFRVTSWIKNFLIFIPIFFAGKIYFSQDFINTAYFFVAFCLCASSIYIINDLIDRKNDMAHPHKKNRPIASQKISTKIAIIISSLLFITAITISAILVPKGLIILLIYFALNLIYSFFIKFLPIFDIILISFFYLLRVLGGGIVSNTPISKWLILCTIFLSLFLIIGKRKSEFEHREIKRSALNGYSSEFLNKILTISISLTLISYCLYTILHLEKNLAIYSIFFPIIAIFRYLLIINNSDEGEIPEKLIIKDPTIIASSICWIIFMYFIVY